jgi:mannose-6-phosphate isomerase-like protein (cupin superfamily)
VRLATFKPGTLEHLHWHLIEVFYYVISGRAIMRDIEGRTYDVGPGSVVYAPPGIAGSHEWDVIEELQLIAVRATTDPERTIQFTVDKKTMGSHIEFDFLMRRGGGEFKKSFY